MEIRLRPLIQVSNIYLFIIIYMHIYIHNFYTHAAKHE